MDSSNCSSIPSEPQDIGKWFSSYVYQSPHLSIEDKREEDFQDSDLSIVPETQDNEDKGEEYSAVINNLLLRKCNNFGEDTSLMESPFCDVQLQRTKESVEGRTDYQDEDHICCLQDSCVSMVPETEESEDVNLEKAEEQNLLTRRDFLLNSCKIITGDKCQQEDLEYADSILPVSELPDLKNWFESYVYESPTLDAGHEIGLWSNVDCRAEADNDGPNHTEGKKEVLLSKSIGTVEREELTSKRAASYSLSEKISEDKCPKHQYYNKSTTQNDSPIKKQLLCETVTCDENCDPIMKDLLRETRAKNGQSVDKETSSNGVADDEGFISTRKSRSKHTQKEKSYQNTGLIKQKIQRIGVYNPSNSNVVKKTPPKREALQEQTNNQSLNNMFEEKTGKWRCPQNTKPDSGPPLKQLRLDQWVRRVRNL